MSPLFVFNFFFPGFDVRRPFHPSILPYSRRRPSILVWYDATDYPCDYSNKTNELPVSSPTWLKVTEGPRSRNGTKVAHSGTLIRVDLWFLDTGKCVVGWFRTKFVFFSFSFIKNFNYSENRYLRQNNTYLRLKLNKKIYITPPKEIYILAMFFIRLARNIFVVHAGLFFLVFFAVSGKQVLLLNAYIKRKGIRSDCIGL